MIFFIYFFHLPEFSCSGKEKKTQITGNVSGKELCVYFDDSVLF